MPLNTRGLLLGVGGGEGEERVDSDSLEERVGGSGAVYDAITESLRSKHLRNT